MRFCPWDGTLLIVDNRGSSQSFRFRCVACPYVSPIARDTPVSERTTLKLKQVDDVLGGEDSWKDVPTTEAACSNCGHREAYFQQLQTRSADEPMTIFYKCAKCGEQWRD
mmetsp:Transcript_13537/g.29114  ORF Transcript_13537/g.29114 Transcript_13537/m.29114 type:complete len:110 (-) Transcript_13537:1914-2243(-)